MNGPRCTRCRHHWPDGGGQVGLCVECRVVSWLKGLATASLPEDVRIRLPGSLASAGPALEPRLRAALPDLKGEIDWARVMRLWAHPGATPGQELFS